MKRFTPLIVIITFFYLLAVLMWLALDEIFYLYNFLIIGTSVGLGIGLWPVFPKNRKHIARLISQLLVGGYMFYGLGCGFIYLVFGYMMPENMQIEGFWFWLLSGVFAAGVIHYLVAKIVGPLIFNRAWCGWACWTAAVLDLLPWKYNQTKRAKKFWNLRYLHFFLSTVLVFILFFVFDYGLRDTLGKVQTGQEWTFTEAISALARIPELWWFLGGNALYYLTGISMAVCLKDNRAFCKYLCPVAVVLKIGSRFALLKIDKADAECIDCGICEKRCPMEVEILKYIKKGKRVSSSECMICETCINNCPAKALKLSFRFSDKIKSQE